MNHHLCCLLQPLLTAVCSLGVSGEGEEIQAIFKGEREAKLHEHGTVPKKVMEQGLTA